MWIFKVRLPSILHHNINLKTDEVTELEFSVVLESLNQVTYTFDGGIDSIANYRGTYKNTHSGSQKPYFVLFLSVSASMLEMTWKLLVFQLPKVPKLK